MGGPLSDRCRPIRLFYGQNGKALDLSNSPSMPFYAMNFDHRITYVAAYLETLTCLFSHTRLLKAHTKILEAHTRLLETHALYIVARYTTGPRRAANNASRNHFTRSARCTTGPRRAVKD